MGTRTAITGLLLTLAIAACSGDAAAPSTTVVPTATTTTTVAATTTEAPTTLPPTTTTVAPTSTTSSVPPTRPLPFESWTAILASLPVAENSAAQAYTVAEKMAVPGAGVLLSDDYPSLSPGFWVVYTAPYEYSWEAVAACERVVDVAPDCYPSYLGSDPEQPVGREHGTLVAITDNAELVVLSASTGEVVRTIDDSFGGNGDFPGTPALAAEGLTIDYSIGFEDYWFSCESSDGHLERLDLATGRSEKTGDGFSPSPSLDAATLLYLASSQCYPDPVDPQFVLAPADTVVWRDTATGSETKRTMPLPGDPVAGYELWDVAAGPDGVYVVDTDGVIWRFPPTAGDAGEVSAVADLAAAGLDAGLSTLVGFDTARGLLLVSYTYFDTDAEFTELHGVDPARGTVERLATYEGVTAFALDATGQHLAVGNGTTLEVDGVELPLTNGVLALAW